MKAQSSRILKLKDCRRFEDEYASNLGILRAKFGRVHGSAENFTKLQANALKKLHEDSKQITSEMGHVWQFLQAIQTFVQKLTNSIHVKQEPPDL